MPEKSIETAVTVFMDRHVPRSAVAQQAAAIQASGVVDELLIPDALVNFVPSQLWTTQNTPMASVFEDPDSLCDAYVMAGYVSAAAPELGIHVSTDSVRRPPAEFVQTMLTVANLTQGRATFQIGGGEIKNLKPYGHPSNQGMSRMEDLFKIFRAFMTSDQPFDFEGRRWTFDQAFLGASRPFEPHIWGLGAGPILIEHSTSYADGLGVSVPMAWTSPDECAERIAGIRVQLERKGRDPDAFRFGLWASVLLHEDASTLERRLQNPIIKFLTGIAGRIETRRWREVGLGLPLPDDFTYFKNLVPRAMDDSIIAAVVDNVSREHADKAWFLGTPEEAADQIQPYIDAGFDWVMPIDFLGLVAEPDEGGDLIRRSIETCGHLKAANSRRVAGSITAAT